jgi:DNA repair protein RecO (recombination protein O)
LNRVDSEPAFVIHRRAWRETSLIVDLLTRSAGRIASVARGARSPRSAWFGLAEPFRLLHVSWTRRGDMATLTDIDLAGHSPALKGTALWCGFYANELVMALLPRDDPDSGLFDAYAALLPELTDANVQAPALRRFECRLLDALGVLPDLSESAGDGAPVEAIGRYRVDPVVGPEPAGSDTCSYPGRLLLALARDQRIDHGDAGDARRLMRTLIEYHLDGRKLRTPSMFRENKA